VRKRRNNEAANPEWQNWIERLSMLKQDRARGPAQHKPVVGGQSSVVSQTAAQSPVGLNLRGEWLEDFPADSEIQGE
jgi:hypothetical protein